METNVATRGGSVLKSYRHTLYASYLGYITQAIVNNFVPLLFTTFIASCWSPLISASSWWWTSCPRALWTK